MECREAAFFLKLRHPGTDELGPDVGALLDSHLATCATCAASERQTSGFDRLVAATMRNVEIPSGLQSRLLANSTVFRVREVRRLFYRGAALAASLVLVAGFAIGLFSASRPQPDTQAWAMNADSLLDPEFAEEAVRKWLVAQDLAPRLPVNFDYSLLQTFGTEEVQGRDVPVVIFRDRQSNGFAKVYILRPTAFDIKDVRDAQASYTQIRTFSDRPSQVSYVVLFTGHSLAPFLRGNQEG